MVSSQMIGVAPVHDPSDTSSVQTTFSVPLQLVGRPVSLVVPSRLGPRHCGQFCAASVPLTSAAPAMIASTAAVVTANRPVPLSAFVKIVLLIPYPDLRAYLLWTVDDPRHAPVYPARPPARGCRAAPDPRREVPESPMTTIKGYPYYSKDTRCLE